MNDLARISARKTLALLSLCAILVALCYVFVDRPVAYFVHEQEFRQHTFFEWLQYPPPYLQAWTPLVLTLLVLRRRLETILSMGKTLFAAGIGIVLAEQFRDSLAYCFGRYWPETWINNNPSLIRDGAYGFHPFQGGSAYRSFPSGHMARTLVVAAIVWIGYPRWRWFSVVATAAMVIGLVGMNYHFVSDIIAGGFVGFLVGKYGAFFARLSSEEVPRSI